MDAQVVQYHMDLKLGGDLPVQEVHESEELLVRVLRVESGDHLSVEDIEGGEEIHRAVALVVVRASFRPVLSHREDGLGSLQGLGLRLLVHAEHDRSLGGVLVDPHHVHNLLLEVLVVAELERLCEVRLEAVSAPNSVDSDLMHAHLLGHRSRGPVGASPGLAVQGLVEDGADHFQLQSGFASRSRGILLYAWETEQCEALSPETYRIGAGLQFLSDRLVVPSVRRAENDLGAEYDPLRGGASSGPSFEAGTFIGRESYRGCYSHAFPTAGGAHNSIAHLCITPLANSLEFGGYTRCTTDTKRSPPSY